MDKIKYYFCNLQFLAKKSLPYTLVLIAISLFICISGLLFSLETNVHLDCAQMIDNNAGIFLPIIAIIFSFSLAFNFQNYVKNYNLSLRYSNVASITLIVLFCAMMAIMYGLSVYLTHIIAYIGYEQVVPIIYNKDFVLVFKGMNVVFFYSLLASSISYFIMKLTNINGYYYLLIGLYIFLLFYAFEQGGYKRDNDNIILKIIHFIMTEDNLWLLIAKVIPISSIIFGLDHIITEYRGVK